MKKIKKLRRPWWKRVLNPFNIGMRHSKVLANIDEMHELEADTGCVASKGTTVILKYTPQEAGLLCEILQFASDELISLDTKNRRSKEPLLNDEEAAHLRDAVKFCTKNVLALFQYTQEEG